MEGPVYSEPATINATVATASNHVWITGLEGPLSTIRRTAKLIRKVKTPSAVAPEWMSTFRVGPPSMCLYCIGITSLIATAPATAPAACQQWILCIIQYSTTLFHLRRISFSQHLEILKFFHSFEAKILPIQPYERSLAPSRVKSYNSPSLPLVDIVLFGLFLSSFHSRFLKRVC